MQYFVEYTIITVNVYLKSVIHWTLKWLLLSVVLNSSDVEFRRNVCMWAYIRAHIKNVGSNDLEKSLEK